MKCQNVYENHSSIAGEKFIVIKHELLPEIQIC